MTRYLRNAWYVAGWARELDDSARLARTLLDEPVLLYRSEGGDPIAIGNRCPHRFAPLNMGKRLGDTIACPYHGLQFDRTGACVFNPHGDGRIPAKAKVPSYPVVERHLLMWIWMGDAAQADPSSIPDYSFLTSGAYHVADPDWLRLSCNYELAADNLMDLSHAVFVHENSFGTPDALRGKLDVAQTGSNVSANIWVADCTPAGAAFPLDGPGKPVDHWIDMEWRPAGNMLLRIGTTRPGQARDAGIEVLAPHLLTPESEFSTHYFFASPLPPSIASLKDVSGPSRPSQRDVFENEDEPILAAVQSMMKTADIWSLDPILLPTDAGAVRVRRVLASLITAETKQLEAAE